MENNEILVFTPNVLAEIPSLAAEREHHAYLDELRKHCKERVACNRVCGRLLEHRLPMPWDPEGALSLLFPMVRTKRLLVGKCAMHGIPEPVALDIWDIHRLCLGSFLPPAEMDDPGMHRVLSPFEKYRGHLAGRYLKRLADPKRADGYLKILETAPADAEVKEDVSRILVILQDLAERMPRDESRNQQTLLALIGLD